MCDFCEKFDFGSASYEVDKYGARIELWFETESGKNYKIATKNYIVEGWMR